MTADELRDINTRYHDGAAAGYDAKWGIDYGATGERQVIGKVRKALGAAPVFYDRALEIGAGTGYFSLNLMLAGIVGRATCTDISTGMVDALRANAQRLDLTVEGVVCGAESLPFDDDTFDLVIGHAVLHHIPDLHLAFAEMRRVLRPGGQLCFAGEPSRRGDRLARIPKRAAAFVAPAWRRVCRAHPSTPGGSDGGAENHSLEPFVDIHAFVPADLREQAERAGFVDVRVTGEELLANWFGWFNRTLEATADPQTVPMWFRKYAFHGYLALQKVDRPLERIVPPAFAYNLLLSAKNLSSGDILG